MTDDNGGRTGAERYEAGAERAREYFRRNGLAAAAVPAGARRLADVLRERGAAK